MSNDAITAILQSHPFTEGFWPEHIARLGALASEVRFDQGELIFHEGDHSSFFYLLISGNVALEVISPGRAVRVGAGRGVGRNTRWAGGWRGNCRRKGRRVCPAPGEKGGASRACRD